MRYAHALEQFLRCHTWCELANVSLKCRRKKWKLFFGLVLYMEKNYPMYKGHPPARVTLLASQYSTHFHTNRGKTFT